MTRSRMFDDDTSACPSPRTTIVGGRPPEHRADLPPIPTGIQTLLRLASVDEAFRKELIAKRGEVASSAGVQLSTSERAILAAIPSVQLEQMSMSVPAPPAARREFLLHAAASAVLVLGGASLQGCPDTRTTGGAAPDLPPPRTDSSGPFAPEPTGPVDDPAPTRPDHSFPAPGGAAPDWPPSPAPTPESEPSPPRPAQTSPTRCIKPDQP